MTLSKEMLREFCELAGAVGLLDLEDALVGQAIKGNCDILRALIAGGADVHANDDLALREAASAGQSESVRTLLAAGANVHARQDEALRFAARQGHADTLRVLLAADADVHVLNDRALVIAAHNTNAEAVEALLEGGADGHAQGDLALRAAYGNDSKLGCLFGIRAQGFAEDELLRRQKTIGFLTEWLASHPSVP